MNMFYTGKMAIVLGIFLLIIGFLGCILVYQVFLREPTASFASLPQGTVSVGGFVYRVDIAESIGSRMRGLSGREALPSDAGMLFIFPISARYGFWMKDMKFPLDFVWIDKGIVVGLTEQVPPPDYSKKVSHLPSYYPPQSVDMVLEINAGEIQKQGIVLGMPIELVRAK
jgi:uncharacterized membrane protein (UPF0127 family)